MLVAGGELAEALEMRFIREVSDGTIAPVPYANYLLIEEAFVRTATRLHGLAVWDAPSWTAVEANARAVHALVGEQTAYFRAARAEWPAAADMSEKQLAQSERLSEFALEAAREGGYAAVMTTLFAAETLYHTWCSAAHEKGNVPPGPIADWVELHAAEPFHAGVRALAAAVDALPADIPDARVHAWFTGMLAAETAFHDAVFG
ncbi:transcriptional regulator [Amycolatopsis acidicola]|uniref:Transcriptional regulator n=1 Tax=Amycolatopsis acidicola TaxID=2596893 RepID=A0A5N0UL67_9PSEU|nr:TenA family protein [Amycolatopsis acidicola]KAA9150185.1 transcriptional regulator [Amycolatopsis acidicola]